MYIVERRKDLPRLVFQILMTTNELERGDVKRRE